MQDVQLHYATKKAYAFMLHNNPHVDKVHELVDDYPTLIEELRQENFDLVIDLHHNLRTRKIKKALGVKSHSFFKSNIAKWLKVNLKIDRLPKMHLVDRYMATVEEYGVVNDGHGLDYFIPTKDEVDIKELFPAISQAYIAFAIGGQHATKQMPKERIKELCSVIKQPVVLLGGKEDRASGDFIAQGLSHVYNACGSINLNQSASVCKQADAVVTHDTGMMHISAALKKKIVSLWGNTIPEFGMYPYMPLNPEKSLVFEVQNLSCRPCSKIGYDRCPKGHHKCMTLHNHEEIVRSL